MITEVLLVISSLPPHSHHLFRNNNLRKKRIKNHEKKGLNIFLWWRSENLFPNPNFLILCFCVDYDPCLTMHYHMHL